MTDREVVKAAVAAMGRTRMKMLVVVVEVIVKIGFETRASYPWLLSRAGWKEGNMQCL